jgi:hypothetical protein
MSGHYGRVITPLSLVGALVAGMLGAALVMWGPETYLPTGTGVTEYQIEEHTVPTAHGDYTVITYCDEYGNRVYLLPSTGASVVSGCGIERR